MRDLVDAVIDLEGKLRRNPTIQVVTFEFYNSPANSGQIEELTKRGVIESTVLDFFRVSDGFEITWRPVDTELEAYDMFGRVKVLPFQKAVRNWSGVVFQPDEPVTSPRRKFFPLDFFMDETAAGFCSFDGYRRMMYLYRFEGDLIPLEITFEGYLRCMLAARGCVYWQYLARELIEGEPNVMSTRIREYLPRLFPDFSAATFEQVFSDVRHARR